MFLSENKKDLTRIEDLAEYLHDLEASEETSFETPLTEDIPEAPFSEDTPSELPPENIDFNSTESTTDFNSDDPFSATIEETSSENSFQADLEQNIETNTTSAIEETSLFDEPAKEFHLDESISTNFAPETSFTDPFESSPEEIKPLEISKPAKPQETETYKMPENFGDLKTFSENTSFTGEGTEANPSFSVLIKNVKYTEDVEDILSLLKEFKLIADTEEQTKSRLMRGSLLIPRVSEFAAIYLAHKLRRFEIEIQMGPSDEIHPPKHQEKPEIGIVSKFNLYQNKIHAFRFDDPKLELSQIIVSATASLDNHQIVRYVGVASEHKILEDYSVENETSDEISFHYQDLAQKLRAHALKMNANAVVGLNYQLTPIPSELGIQGHKYRLSCTGNLVWVNKL